MMDDDKLRDEIDDEVCVVMMDHGHDGHVDGHDLLTELVLRRVAAERAACREVVEECIRTQAHLASNAREALSEASARIYKRGRA